MNRAAPSHCPKGSRDGRCVPEKAHVAQELLDSYPRNYQLPLGIYNLSSKQMTAGALRAAPWTGAHELILGQSGSHSLWHGSQPQHNHRLSRSAAHTRCSIIDH